MDIPEGRLAAALAAISQHFGARWFTRTGTPLQALWARKDLPATWELFWFGMSLQNLESIDRKWITDHVNHIKVGARNQKIGSVFDILMLAMFAGETQEIIPAKRNQAGYDGTLRFQDGTLGVLSLKNFAKTQFQQTFETRAARLYKSIELPIRETQRPWVGVLAMLGEFPNNNDWDSLTAFLLDAIRSGGPSGVANAVGNWTVRETAAASSAKLHRGHRSYTVQLICKQHDNERKNIDTRMEEAFVGFNRHVLPSGTNSSNVMLIRLREAASLAHHAQWAVDFLKRVNTTLDEVFL